MILQKNLSKSQKKDSCFISFYDKHTYNLWVFSWLERLAVAWKALTQKVGEWPECFSLFSLFRWASSKLGPSDDGFRIKSSISHWDVCICDVIFFTSNHLAMKHNQWSIIVNVYWIRNMVVCLETKSSTHD